MPDHIVQALLAIERRLTAIETRLAYVETHIPDKEA